MRNETAHRHTETHVHNAIEIMDLRAKEIVEYLHRRMVISSKTILSN